MNKKELHIVQGMTRDTYVSQFNPTMVCDARNIRITSMGKNRSLLSVTNEKGPAEFEVTGDPIIGTIIGCSSLNNILTLFTTQDVTPRVDRIYKLTFNDSDYSSAVSLCLFEGSEETIGSLGFDEEHPIEALSVFENENIQKVYWIDGKNQPRMINIAANTVFSNNDVFNFNRKIGSGHSIKIEKFNTGGQFPAGTIQYCFNYFNKFGQETNIVDVSPLYYLCPQEKGLPADATDTSSFMIELTGLNMEYDYVRLYSIIRTSENSAPITRIVGDYRISASYPIPPVERTYEDVTVNSDNFYVVEGNTFTPKYKVYDKFGEISSTDFYELSDNEFLCDISTRTIYLYEANGTELKQFCADYSDGEYTLPYNGLMSSYLYSGQIGTSIAKKVSIVDNGVIGSSLDSQALLFIGGQDIVAGAITAKDNTLFLGNIKNNIPNVGTIEVSPGNKVKDIIKGNVAPCVFDFDGSEKDVAPIVDSPTRPTSQASDTSFYNYDYNNNTSSYEKKSFKAREGYRLGFIAQYNTGQWSEVVWIDDCIESYTPSIMMFYETQLHVNAWGGYYKKPGFKGTISSDIVNSLLEKGFIRVAPVACYPEEPDRMVPYQGILSGTVYNALDRDSNSPFVQADWRFRTGYADCRIDGEIQANTTGAAPYYPVCAFETPMDGEYVLSATEFLDRFGNQFYRDSSIVTFHSPDVELNDSIIQGNLTDLKLRIVGISTLAFNRQVGGGYANQTPEKVASGFLFTSTLGYGPNSTKRDFDYFAAWRNRAIRRSQYTRDERSVSSESAELSVKDFYADLAFIGFRDYALVEETTGDQNSGYEKGEIRPFGSLTYYEWITYLWHRSGSLNNQKPLSTAAQKLNSKRYALLEKKCVSEIQYSRTTFFQSPQTIGPEYINIDINQPILFDSDQLGVSKIDVGNKVGMNYYGNIDKVISPICIDTSELGYYCPIGTTQEMEPLSSYGYPIEYATTSGADYTHGRHNVSPRYSQPRTGLTGDETYPDAGYGADPVRMKYKSTRHIVIGLNSDTNAIVQLGIPPFSSSSYPTFWEDNASIERIDALDGQFVSLASSFSGIRNVVYVAELYREFSENAAGARFGGTSDSAITNNVWRRCGESVVLHPNEDATIYYREGDVYVGRYDCLKTYPFTHEDQNQIVSIFSTELESRVNLDARYDKNRGLADNTFADPTNFNLYNHPGYEQSNQFFTYKAIDYDRYNFDDYPNMITWSLEKKMGADIDAWTSMYMLSTADLDGKLGEVTKLATFNDTLYGFQPRGVSQILYNERVQIPASDGQPIEITNGLKYGGVRYLSNQIGLTNKWSFCETPLGMYFIDDEKDTLYYFNGQQFQDLSTKAGFRTWLKQNNSYSIWNPKHFSNIRTYYDKVNSDIYFMTKNESLVYSEQLGTFTSFMDYAKLPMVVNMNDGLFTFTENPDTNEDTAWKFFSGCYNVFFGNYKPYWLTFIANSDSTIDKVFNNLAWRTVDHEGCELKPLQTFDSLRVWNDHQDTGQVALISKDNKPSILKKKFNVFRVQIPRDKLGSWSGKGLNRIRNPWTYIQLARVEPNTDFMTFQDMEVDFFE